MCCLQLLLEQKGITTKLHDEWKIISEMDPCIKAKKKQVCIS